MKTDAAHAAGVTDGHTVYEVRGRTDGAREEV